MEDSDAEGDFFSTDPHMRTPYIQNFNLNLQQQLGSKTVLQVGYVGPSASSCSSSWISISPARRRSRLPIWVAIADQQQALARVPRTVAPNFFYLNQEKSAANSSYHSLQASLRTAGWHGLTSQANFVWSHSIDTPATSRISNPTSRSPPTAPIRPGTMETPASTSAAASPGTSSTSSPRWAARCRS